VLRTGSQHLISVRPLSTGEIGYMFDLAAALRAMPHRDRGRVLDGRVVATAFYQPSTRTRLAFESAVLRLGGRCTGFADASTTRAGDFYQESLEDVVGNLGWLADAIVLRHFESGAAQRAAAVSPVPVINAGDGYNEHPSQALGDVWAMHQILGGVAGSSIGLLGNPHIRSLHSISLVLAKLAPAEVAFLPAPDTDVPRDVRQALDDHQVKWSVVDDVRELLARCDLVETIGTRHPDHRLSRQEPASTPSRTPDRFRIDAAKLARAGRTVPVLHPGPRTDEVDVDVDALPVAQYLPQVEHGMWMKAAMVAVSLCERSELPDGAR
jgi:aspartate carbamoyltransferase catalytic subunit